MDGFPTGMAGPRMSGLRMGSEVFIALLGTAFNPAILDSPYSLKAPFSIAFLAAVAAVLPLPSFSRSIGGNHWCFF
jgi:hypothetical protein